LTAATEYGYDCRKHEYHHYFGEETMTDQREILDVDVLFLGAGPASLAAAYHLQQLVNAHNEQGEAPSLEPMIVVVEKAREVGAHAFSGAVLDPISLRELVPDFQELGCPVEKVVDNESVYYLTKTGSFRFPIVPPQLQNHGNLVISLAKFTRWLGGLCEGVGVNIFPGFAGVEILEDGGVVTGIRTGDKGIDKNGERKSNFEFGIDLKAKVTAFGDGPRGYLSKQLIERRNLLDGKIRQTFETGVKEVFEMPAGSVDDGRVIHTMGYPFGKDAVGGTWIYNMADNMVSIGLVTPLDYKDPFLEPHTQLQQFKEHPLIKKTLSGGKSVAYGAKVISAGGYHSIPKLYTDGALLIGESGSLVDMARLKGVHLAIKSGILAAETLFNCMKADDYSATALAPYEAAVYDSYIGKQMRKSRNFHRAMSLGMPRMFFHLGIQQMTGGADILSYKNIEEDRYTLDSVTDYYGADRDLPEQLAYDGEQSLDKVSNVYNSGTMHNEDQPSHLKVLDTSLCYDKCTPTFRYPCNRFCPASVYEMITPEESGENIRLQVNFANCVHCQTCDIKCPLDNIRWTPPEGGDGPNYTLL